MCIRDSSIRGVVGIFGILLIGALVLIPIIKILAISAIYKITALLIEPVASKKLAQGVGAVSYTHLDVYKRQTMRKFTLSWNHCRPAAVSS